MGCEAISNWRHGDDLYEQLFYRGPKCVYKMFRRQVDSVIRELYGYNKACEADQWSFSLREKKTTGLCITLLCLGIQNNSIFNR